MGQALYRLETKIVGRRAKDKAGRPVAGRQVSVVAKAAYRAGQSLNDERAAHTFNYRSRAPEVAYSEILAPGQAPEWLRDPPEPGAGARAFRELRERLWNEVERVEKRKDSQLAREFLASLPAQLNRPQQIELLRDWIRSEVVSKGYVADFNLHKSKKGNNPHAHILCPMRPLTENGFGKKPSTDGKFNGRGVCGQQSKDELLHWRKSWADYANAALEKAGFEERVDHRSLKDRGIDRTPEPKIGVAALAMKRKGIDPDPDRVRLVRQTRLENDIWPLLQGAELIGVNGKENGVATWWQRTQDVLDRFKSNLIELIRSEAGAVERNDSMSRYSNTKTVADHGPTR